MDLNLSQESAQSLGLDDPDDLYKFPYQIALFGYQQATFQAESYNKTNGSETSIGK